MDEAARCPECGYTDADARRHMDHHRCENYPFFTQPGGYEVGCVRSDVPTGHEQEAENLVLPFFHFWKSKINDCSLIMKFEDPAAANRAFKMLEGMESVKAVVVDTNKDRQAENLEECPTCRDIGRMCIGCRGKFHLAKAAVDTNEECET